jgi:hypothetical protein
VDLGHQYQMMHERNYAEPSRPQASNSSTRTAVARACGSGSGYQKRPDPIRSVIVERSAAYPDPRGAMRLRGVGDTVGNLRQRILRSSSLRPVSGGPVMRIRRKKENNAICDGPNR